MIAVAFNTINFLPYKLQQLISLNRAQEMGKEVLGGLAEKSVKPTKKIHRVLLSSKLITIFLIF
jgi:hypothetical protein